MEDQPQSVTRDDVRQFHIHFCLGSGGFGEVYKATMTSAGGVRHEVAIKVLHEGLDPRSQAVQRLRDEGTLLGVLRHPAILRVHDLVLLAGRVSLVTEYIEGGDLEDCIRDGQMPVRALVDVCGQVASALNAAWNTDSPNGDGKLHLVHRDVKPANIRVGVHGECKLLDFGIAKAAGVKREAHTQARALIGSYLYMSPERLDRREGLVPEGDIYALGAVLYEGVARERLFGHVDLKEQYKLSWDAGEHDQFVRRKVDAVAGLDPRVRDLILRTLAHDETERPSALEMSRLCEQLSDELPGVRLRAWCRARTWPAPEEDRGALGGRTITETAFTTGTISGSNLDAMTRTDAQGATSYGYLDRVNTLHTPADETPERRGSGARPWILAGAVAFLGIGLMGSLGLFGLATVAFNGVDGAEAPTPSPMPVAAPEPAPAPEPAAAPEPAELPEPEGTPEAAPEPEPEPAPAPKPVPAPAKPAPRPKPAPVAKPAPATKPDAAAETGTVTIRGSVPVQLRGAGKSLKPGTVPAGSYEIWADFGQGLTRASMDMVTVSAGSAITLKCSSLRQDCQVQ